MTKPIFLVAVLLATAASAEEPNLPGGKPSSEPRDCSNIMNHCQRGDWFVTGYSNEIGNAGMRPAFRRDGKWFLWDGSVVDGGTAYRTRTATAATLATGHQAVVFAGPKPQPGSELEALTSRRWSVVLVTEIDGDAGTFVADGGTYAIASARVLFDPEGI